MGDKKPQLIVRLVTPNYNFLEALDIYQQILNINGEEHPFQITYAHFGTEELYSTK